MLVLLCSADVLCSTDVLYLKLCCTGSINCAVLAVLHWSVLNWMCYAALLCTGCTICPLLNCAAAMLSVLTDVAPVYYCAYTLLI